MISPRYFVLRECSAAASFPAARSAGSRRLPTQIDLELVVDTEGNVVSAVPVDIWKGLLPDGIQDGDDKDGEGLEIHTIPS